MTPYVRTNQIINDSLDVPQPMSADRVSYPFFDRGDSQTYVLEKDFMVYMDKYQDTLPLVGTPHPDYPELYFASDTPIQEINGGIGKFTRTWTCIPGMFGDAIVFNGTGSWAHQEGGSTNWTRPAIDTSIFGRLYYVGTVEYIDTEKVKLYTQTRYSDGLRWTHDINTNYNTATIGWSVFDSVANVYNIEKEYTSVIHERGSDYIIVDRSPYESETTSTTFYYQYFTRPKHKREVQPIIVPKMSMTRYLLEGVNCDKISDVREDQWQVIDENQNITDTITELTTPSIAEYNEMVASGSWVVAEPGIPRRWMGNIWEFEVKYVQVK